RFEQLILPHLDAAYNLARWLTHNDQDAQDVVQEAYLRAFKFFHSFRGGDSRSWLLTIVRNTCYTWLQRQHIDERFDEELHDTECAFSNPEDLHIQQIEQGKITEALNNLPTEFREIIVLREIEDLSYKDISAIMHIPLGTVMSRLARARKQLQRFLTVQKNEEA
ncbi:MAG TPA: sigma-70 family RNA polymerase sigma factor, partial [Ktedonobacteraceae bacterium]|nr:sigma-70 family RNA polymerase sigma factor [Ktedonobacteraceae bacterium]